jgi:PEP-CTERM motif
MARRARDFENEAEVAVFRFLHSRSIDMHVVSFARAAAVALAFVVHAASAQPLASAACFAAGNFAQDVVGTESTCAIGGSVQDAQLDAVASSSSASASLRAGQMHATANAQALVTQAGVLKAGSFGQTFLADTLTASGTLSGPTTIVLGMHVDGGFAHSFYARSQGTDVMAYLRDDTPDSNLHFNGAAITIALGSENEAYVANLVQPSSGSVQVGALDAIDAIGFDLQVAFVVTAANPSFSFRALLQTDALLAIDPLAPYPLDTQTISANFGDTAQLYVMAPEGITLSSASGVFLTAVPVIPVPEPGTWLQMLAGLGLLARLARRGFGTTR